MPTLHSWLRHSTPEQGIGDSDRRQIDELGKWAAEYNWEFKDAYRATVSAFRGNQLKHLQRFFDDVRSGLIPPGDALGCENFDRLSREPPLDSFDLFRSIVMSGV